MRTITIELPDDLLASSIVASPLGIARFADRVTPVVPATEEADEPLRHDTPREVVIAATCHEASRQYARSIGESNPPPSWQGLSGELQAAAIELVRRIQDGTATSPEQAHDQWSANRRDAGWTYGPQASFTNKTHPNLVSFTALPPEQRKNSRLLFAVASALLAPE